MLLLQKVKSFDWILLCAVSGILLFGGTALYSIGLGRESATFLERQLAALAIGVVCLVGISLINYRTVKSFSLPIYACSMVLLVAVLFFGEHVRGTRGWFFWGEFGFQPVELAKIALIIGLARYLSSWSRQVSRLRPLIVSALIAALPIGLTLFQPDFGSAAILAALWLALILVNGISRRAIAALGIIGIVLTLCAWLFLFQDYQKDRILSFLFPRTDVSGAGYNVRQALIAIGGGQLTGMGIGAGSGSQLRFLPEAQTDFIFSVIAEELGFFGVSTLFLFWIVFYYRLVSVLRRANDDFAACIVVGVLTVIFAQFAFTIGGNLGLIPITGLVLPFISYGGSSLVASLALIGFVQSVRIHSA